jgi:hypothetical protein
LGTDDIEYVCIPEQTFVFPDIVPATAGAALFTVIAKVCAELEPQELVAVTLRVPDVAPVENTIVGLAVVPFVIVTPVEGL